MKVVQFPARPPAAAFGVWHTAELQNVIDACAASILRGEISGWEVGTTEAGDPQLYLLGPAPECECITCVSRVGRLYILEDGQGRVVFEHDAIHLLAEQMRMALQRKKAAIVARIVFAWIALKETFEERVEPVLAEPAELLSHVAPQLAVLA